MPVKARFRLGFAVLAVQVLLGAASPTEAETISRSVVGSGWGWSALIKPGFTLHIVGTVGQPGGEASQGGTDGWFIGSGFWIPATGLTVVGVGEPLPRSSSNQLEQNVPNPFNPSTTISFNLAARASVELIVMDVRGRVVDVLLRESRDAGSHQIEYRPADLPSGVYFYRLRAGSFVQTRRFVLLK